METPTEEKKETEKEDTDEKKETFGDLFSRLFINFGLLGFIQFVKETNATWLPSKEEYIHLKAKMEEYERSKIKDTIWKIFSIGISMFFVYFGNRAEGWTHYFSGVGALLITGVLVIMVLEPNWITTTRQRIREYELTYVQNEAQADPFKNSIKTSYTYLDRYYDQTQQQAKSGFRITSLVAIFGAGLISVGVLLLFFGDNEKITPAYITCASGVITEFISSIFFAMYNKTVTSMNSYHDKLVLSQNIAFALRVADSLEKNKDAAKLEIIKELMKDVNAQMMKSDADDTEPAKKKPSPDAETPSGNE